MAGLSNVSVALRRAGGRVSIVALVALAACEPRPPEHDLSGFLAAYGREYQTLRTAVNEADWALNTRILPGDTTAASASERAHLALAAFSGDPVLQTRIRGAWSSPT